MTLISNITQDRVGRVLLTVMAVAIAIFVLYFILGNVAPDSSLLTLGYEDQPLEYVGAVCWAATSLLCAYRLIRGQQPRVLLVLWMVLSLVFFGEEISWGQRIIGFETPEAIEQINDQGEFNVHNLAAFRQEYLGVQNLFRLGFATYFLLFPLLTYSSRISDWAADRIGYVAPGAAFLIMVWGVIAASFLLQAIGPEAARRVTVETRESFYAFSVLVYAYLYLRTAALPSTSDKVAADRGEEPAVA